MTESKKERISILTGRITETPNSDSSVTQKYVDAKNQAEGLPEGEIIIDGEALKPHTMIPSDVLNDPGENDSQHNVVKLDHTNSMFALDKQRERAKKLKKAA